MARLFHPAWVGLFTLASITTTPCSAQSAQDAGPKQSTATAQRMSSGLLAVVSNIEGSLFVDGERKAALVPDKVITLKLTAGQHFVDLRDAKGAKVWEKVVSVPVGAQIVEKIGVGTDVRREAAEGSSPKTNPDPPALLRRPTKLFEEYVLSGFPPMLINKETKETAERQVRECESHTRGEDKFTDGAARSWACASTLALALYVLGRYGESLHFADEDIENQERTFDSQFNLFELSLESISKAYSLRAHTKHALGDENGALADLNAALAYFSKYRQVLPGYIQKIQKSNPTSNDVATLYERLASSNEQALHLYRAIALKGMRRFEEAMVEANVATGVEANTIRLEIQSAIIKDPGVPAPSKDAHQVAGASGRTAPEAVPESVRAAMLSGEWTAENGHATATVSVSGIKFSANLDMGLNKDGSRCMTPTEHCIWEFTGTINGLSIDGVVTLPGLRVTRNSCEIPAHNEHFTATIEQDGQRVIINTQQSSWYADDHDSKKWPWDRPKIECGGIRVAGTEPFIVVLRSNSLNRP